MNAVPTLSTPRLRLRGFNAYDLDTWAGVCADAEVMAHIGGGGPLDRAAAWRHLALCLGQWALRGYGIWAVELRAERRLIGSVGVLHPEGWPGAELSWLLARDAWGQGYAREAALAARSFSRDALGVGTLISLIRPGNSRSLKLAQTLGATDTGSVELLGAPAQRYLHPAATPSATAAARLGG